MIVGLCHGCFDILHPGHLEHLETAKAQVDKLVVGITSDWWVWTNKGDGHPFVRQEERARILRALRCVDEVIIDDYSVPDALLWRLKPDIYFKGEDYLDPIQAMRLNDQRRIVESYGGKLVILGAKTYSSTALAEKLNAFGS